MENTDKNQHNVIQIDIVVRGQLYNQADRIVYSSNPKNDDWARKIPYEHRNILDELHIDSKKQCITIWNIPDNVCYSICQDPQQRPGSAAVVMVRASQAASNPLGLIACMKELMDYILLLESEKYIDSDEIKKIRQKMIPCFDKGAKPQVESRPGGIMAWLEYSGNDQLEKLCLFLPFQTQMKVYECVHLVDRGDHENVKNSDTLKLYDAIPILPVYFFQQPDGGARVIVTVDDKEVEYVLMNQKFELTYKKNGYDNKFVNDLTSSSEVKYFDKIGYTICLKSAENADIVFTKKISIVVKDENTGDPISDWKYWTKNHTKKTDGTNGVHLADGKHELHIIANGYNEKVIDIDTKDSDSIPPVRLTVKGFEKAYILKPTTLFCKQNGWDVTVAGKETGRFWKKFKDTQKLRVSRVNWIWLALLIGVAMLVGGGIGGWFIRETVNLKAESSCPTGDVTDSSHESEQKKTPFSRTNEEHDIAYLNSHDVWYHDSLKSAYWISFFEITLPNKNTPWKDSRCFKDAKDKITHWGWKMYYNSYYDNNQNYMREEICNVITNAIKEENKVDWSSVILTAFNNIYKKELQEIDKYKKKTQGNKGIPNV